MQWTSILAIYAIIWFFCLFMVLPFHARKADDAAPLVPGQAESAPSEFPIGRVALQVSIFAAVMCGLYVANYNYGWITANDIMLTPPPPAR